MTDLSVAKIAVAVKPKNKVRFVTAASLFDGHDASIYIMRRILESTGSRVTNLNHNRWCRKSSTPRCRRTPRATASPPTRAVTSSSSST